MSALRVERDGPVLRVTLARPDRRNAFDAALIRELAEAFADVGDAGAVVLAGEGKSFCAGADVEWQRSSIDLSYDENVEDALRLYRMCEAIDACPAPVVAHVQGHALGGGSGLVACSDIVVADAGTVFGFTEVRLGIIPAVISPFVLPRVGAAARRYFLTGERFGAAEALRIGLVDEVRDAGLDERVEEIVADLLAGGPEAVRAAKRLVRERPGGEEAARIAADRRASAEGQEGLRAFLRETHAHMEIRKLLVANRGEIAARIFATCDRLGIATVAVAAPDDAGAFHTRRASEVAAVPSYLDSGALVEAAVEVGADAVHPGYGFLAENADFAAAVAAAGLRFVGPSPDAIRASGDKLEAKRLAGAAGVPVVPTGDPGELGFPLIVKAAAGGGGRGMRVVRRPDELDEALEAARREAKAGFGDDRVFCERLVERPRHVEVQLLADTHGTVVHLGERDCSVQRRHQKVLEESPSPAVGPDLRAELGEAAIAFARAVGYENAGTAEFMLADGEFFFLELNPRIQVEHPVTELVTGADLVEEQIRIAAGERLAPPTDSSGHAVEARLYAEDPLSFLPRTGTITRLRFPESIRVDRGVEEGDEVGVSYDPLLAKLVAGGETRADALDALAEALRETEVRGVETNLPFLRWLVAHPEIRAGEATTAFLAENPPLSRPRRVPRAWARPWRLNAEAAPANGAPPTLEATAHAESLGAQSTLTAPMPGVVIRVLAAEGDRVAPRQPLVVLEAMKMETPLVSPYEAVVRRVHVEEGDRVAGGALLVELEE